VKGEREREGEREKEKVNKTKKYVPYFQDI
jgi:hypothetical protein